MDDDFSSLEEKINDLDSMDVFSNDFHNEIDFPSNLFLKTLDRVYSIVVELKDITFEANLKDLHDILSSILNSLEKTLFDENDEKYIVLFNNLFVSTLFCLNQVKVILCDKVDTSPLEKNAIIVESELSLIKRLMSMRKNLLERKIARVSSDINNIKTDLKAKHESLNPYNIIEKEVNFHQKQSYIELYQILFLFEMDFDVNLFFEVSKNSNVEIDDEFLLLTKFLLRQEMLNLDIEFISMLGIPKSITDFIFHYMEEYKFKNVLLPWFKLGILKGNMVPFFKDKNIVALIKDESLKKIYSQSYEEKFDIEFETNEIDYRKEIDRDGLGEYSNFEEYKKRIDTLKEQDKNNYYIYSGIEDIYQLDKKFDFLIGFQEENRDVRRLNINSSDGEIVLEDTVSNLEMIASCANLKKDGIAFFVVDPDILFKRDPDHVIMNLNKFGLYIDSILEYRPKKDVNVQDMDFYRSIILVIKRHNPFTILVAELTKDQNYNNIIINNLKNRREGKIPSLGCLTSFEDFYSFDAFYQGIDYEKMLMASPFDKFKFKDIKIKLDDGVNDDDNENLDNSLYLIFSGSNYNKAITTDNELEVLKNNIKKYSIDLNPIFQYTDKIQITYDKLLEKNEQLIKIIDKTGESLPYTEEYHYLKEYLLTLKKIEFTNTNELMNIDRDLKTLSMMKHIDFIDGVRIDIDPDKASAEYTAKYLNSEIGQKLLNSLKTKKSILGRYDIDTDRLMEKYIAIPNLDVQKDVLRTDSLIKDLSLTNDSFKKDLWNYPQRNESINKSVKLFFVGNRMEHWINSLPFPLSSILASCGADSDYERKVRYLVHFFEAFSEFNSMILLSAIIRDKSLCRDKFGKCLNDIRHPDWIYKPSFGNWNFLGSCLAKKVRILRNNKLDREMIFELFGNPNPEFMEMLSNKDIYNIFTQSAQYRNEWIGHGPPVNSTESQRRFETLVDLLSKTREIVGNIFDDTLFIQPVPDSMSYDGGIFSTNVKKVIGRLPFKDHRVETLHALKLNRLYILHPGQYEALELLPFIRIMPGPKTEQNACYFYNRYNAKRVGHEVEMISYHFQQDHTASAPYNEFKTLISIFDK